MVNRVGGLASGMDIDALVGKLMKAERAPLYKLQQQKTKYEWQRDAYRSVNTKLTAFSNYTFDNLILSGSFVKKNPSITGVNSNKVTVKAGAGASGSLNIQAVKQLASNASTGVKKVSETTHRFATEKDTLGDIGITSSDSIKLNVSITDADGKIETKEQIISFKPDSTIEDFVNELKKAGLTDSKFDTTTGKLSISGDAKTTYAIADSNSEKALKLLGFNASSQSKSIKLNDGKTNATNDTLLSDIGITAGTFRLKVGDTEKSITIQDNDTINSLLEKLNADADINASFNTSTGKFTISSNDSKKSISPVDDEAYSILNKLGIEKTTTTNAGYIVKNKNGEQSQTVTGKNLLGHLGLEDGTITLNAVQANGEMKKTTISYSKYDTIDSFVKKLNSSGAGVTALFSNGQITMTANNSGQAKDKNATEIQLIDDSSGRELMEKLGFIKGSDTPTNGSFDLTSSTTRGKNAIYAVNGLYMESNSNAVNVSGYEIVLSGTFNESAIDDNKGVTAPTNPNDTVQVSSTNDIDSMVDKIKEFVSKYNELIAGINDQLKETRYKDYTPLTSEQRAEMSEEEQKLWDAKAKSGLLRSDSILRDGLSDMRSALGGRVDGLGDDAINTLAKMGITTSSSYQDGGKLVIDDVKLRKALAEDPDRVINTLTQSGEKNSVTGKDTRGLLVRARDSITNFTRNIERKAGKAAMTESSYSLGKSLISTDERITKLQVRLKDTESRYWRQFTAMEKAINKGNQQSSMFMQGAG